MPKNNKNNRHYSKEFKESVLKRLTPPTNDTITSISEELGIPRTTIYQWMKKKNKNSTTNKPANKWTSKDKIHAVLETATFTEEEIAQYCRRKGIYIDDLKAWSEQCLNANSSITEDPKKLKETLKEEQQRNKELERELMRKEKALAEAAALLVLRKKAQAIWGDPEEE